jgi:hypothetical protein
LLSQCCFISPFSEFQHFEFHFMRFFRENLFHSEISLDKILWHLSPLLKLLFTESEIMTQLKNFMSFDKGEWLSLQSVSEILMRFFYTFPKHQF